MWKIFKIILIIQCFLLINIAKGSSVSNAAEELRLLKSQEIRQYINESADICENFYNFACGKWPLIKPATETRIQTNRFQQATVEWKQKISLTLATNDNEDTKIERKVKNFYQACLKPPNLSEYKNELLDIVREFGNMPIFEGDSWQQHDFDWLETIGKIAFKYDIKIILGISIQPDPNDYKRNAIFIKRPNFKSSEVYLYSETQEKYKDQISWNLKSYLTLNASAAQRLAQEIFDFEAALIKDNKDDPLALTDPVNKTNIKELQTKYGSNLDIKKLLQKSLGFVPSGDIYEMYTEYQMKLIKVLKTTPKHVIANYIFYKLITKFLTPTLDSGQRQLEECQQETKYFFSNVLDSLTYRKYGTEQAELAVSNIFADLKSVFESALSSEARYGWISKRTRGRAVEKLKAMKIKINDYKDYNFTAAYGSLNLNDYGYIENLKSIYTLEALKARNKLNKPSDPYYDGAKFSSTPQYVLTENLIRIPASMLQPNIFWSFANPAAVNLGQLGYLIGHEMVHALDDMGRQFDKNGNFKGWWDKSSASNFANHTQCFINQTKTYKYAGKSLPMTQFQAENIADNGGMRLAYDTFVFWYLSSLRAQTAKDSESLPNLNYQNKQLFFLSYAQVWCAATHSDYIDSITMSDTHLPPELRINGPLSNYEEFSKVFNCPLGSGMNPLNKCEVY